MDSLLQNDILSSCSPSSCFKPVWISFFC